MGAFSNKGFRRFNNQNEKIALKTAVIVNKILISIFKMLKTKIEKTVKMQGVLKQLEQL